LHGFFDFLGRIDPTSHHYRSAAGAHRASARISNRTAEVDRILAKINEQGLHSLTDSEKRTLRDASRQGS
jgi:hypothetical protein